MMNKMKALLTEEQGQGMTEYGLVLGVIAVGVVTILITMRTQITALFTKASTALTNMNDE
ncbi:Flp family type IVb pilin [Bacillus sp. S3]|uniref:Flp family type IVb pilin n=1 Tax=Bacillus sp. S3 TaxID=486398 RepID=UPI0011881F48|nr:Flp family type IVb pilin [Bacillus sp. S3]QCJ41716.1 Flp family type IVb pilin [Bacillus sp. S3]